MADATLAQIAASIHPGKWVKGETSEDSLKKFDRWIEAYTRCTNLCLINPQQKLTLPRQWDLLISTGGNDLHNIIKEAQIITIASPRVDAIEPCQAYSQGRAAVPGSG